MKLMALKKNIKKKRRNIFLVGALIGLFLCATGVYAATSIYSINVTYDNSTSNLSSSTVQDAIDELYGMCKQSTVSGLSLGDYVSYTPSSTSYTTDTAYTGYTSTQTIDPSELTLWRVISMSTDGTVDIISEYVSSVSIYFKGITGYLNFVGYLNTLAKQYENTTYTSGSRYFGYGGQTEYITDTSMFTTTAPWTSSTGSSTIESQGGGDTLYTTDYNLVYSVLGTRMAYTPSGTLTGYWMASRHYTYSSETGYYWYGRGVTTSGGSSRSSLYGYNSSAFNSNSSKGTLRPIVTLKSGLTYTGSGTEDDPWVLST